MNIKKITPLFAALTLLILPAISSASTYQYVSTSGSLLSLEANSATEALATAPNLATHSGVILVGADGKITQGEYEESQTDSFYQYVNTSGQIQNIQAVSASAALVNATNIAPHSGVILVTTETKITK